eukprot:UN10026
MFGTFGVYLLSNLANKNLPTSLVCLYYGARVVLTPPVDIIRTCYFPEVDEDDESCGAPDNEILVGTLCVFIGILMYSYGEKILTEKHVLSEGQNDNTSATRTIIMAPSIGGWSTGILKSLTITAIDEKSQLQSVPEESDYGVR